MQETQVQSLGQEDPLEENMATHCSVLAWQTQGRRSLAGESSKGYKESDTAEQLSVHRLEDYYTIYSLQLFNLFIFLKLFNLNSVLKFKRELKIIIML